MHYTTLDTDTTKKCPGCGNEHLVELRTINRKACTDCHCFIRWELDEGQAPVAHLERITR